MFYFPFQLSLRCALCPVRTKNILETKALNSLNECVITAFITAGET